MKNFSNNQKGFTIIEVMISVALFTVITTVGIGALLNANDIHKKNQKIRTILDNMSFIIEDMSRNLRTGSNIVCDNGMPSAPNCLDGSTIDFVNNNADGDPWTYRIAPDGDFNDIEKISTSPTGSQEDNVLNPPEVELDGDSGFIVTGADATDTQQPYIIIKLSGNILYKGVKVMPFILETAVSQRLIDTQTAPPIR